MRARHALRPRRNLRILAYRLRIAACCDRKHIGFRSLYMTGLNHFTLSHCGSRTPLPTLKPHLTASAPRLSTDCLPSFIGSGVSPDYTARTEPAHSCSLFYPNECEKATKNSIALRGLHIPRRCADPAISPRSVSSLIIQTITPALSSSFLTGKTATKSHVRPPSSSVDLPRVLFAVCLPFLLSIFFFAAGARLV